MFPGMQDKHKKIILNIIILSALASTFVSLFSPITSIDYSDVLEKNGIKDPTLYWKYERSLILHHYSVYYSNNEVNSEYHRYSDDFYIINFESGDKSLADEFSSLSFYRSYLSNRDNPFATGLSNIINLTCLIFVFLLFVFLVYKGIKNIYVGNNKYFLYIAILLIISLIIFLIMTYYLFDFMDYKNLGYTDVINLGYGFFTIIASTFLFLIVFFMQKYFLDLPKETKITNENI